MVASVTVAEKQSLGESPLSTPFARYPFLSTCLGGPRRAHHLSKTSPGQEFICCVKSLCDGEIRPELLWTEGKSEKGERANRRVDIRR